MTLHDMCCDTGDQHFKIGKSNVVWECAIYCGRTVRVSRMLKPNEKGGIPFIMGLRQQVRYVSPKVEVIVVKQKIKNL